MTSFSITFSLWFLLVNPGPVTVPRRWVNHPSVLHPASCWTSHTMNSFIASLGLFRWTVTFWKLHDSYLVLSNILICFIVTTTTSSIKFYNNSPALDYKYSVWGLLPDKNNFLFSSKSLEAGMGEGREKHSFKSIFLFLRQHGWYLPTNPGTVSHEEHPEPSRLLSRTSNNISVFVFTLATFIIEKWVNLYTKSPLFMPVICADHSFVP